MATAQPNWQPSTLGGLLAFARDAANLNQEDLAEACGVSRALVSRWENDGRLPDVSEIETWAKTTKANWLLPTLREMGLLVKVTRWELQAAARYWHGHLRALPSQLDRRYRSSQIHPPLLHPVANADD